MIKYLGSKRRLVPVLREVCRASGARTALDLFTGTTRVAQAFKAEGVHVTATDSARYAHVFARAYVETDAGAVDAHALQAAVDRLNAVPGRPGYVHETFSCEARFFQPDNAARIDAVRDAIEDDYAGTPLYPVLLTSLIEAADRVDSTTGVQMAYVKRWAPRSYNPLELRVPELLAGPGRAILGDAMALAPLLGHFDLAYLDPPYNQHRYFTNYHVWETLVAWDAPEAYGVARKRIDARDATTRSVFNSKRTMPAALASVVRSVDCDLLVLSYNDESWLDLDELQAVCAAPGPRSEAPRATAILAFDSARYVGARIGIYDPSGRKVGQVGHLSNQELLIIAGEAALVRQVVDAVRSLPPQTVASPRSVRTPGNEADGAPMVDRLQQAT
ncbi:MAG TPA: DNA adenine methylase [Acidimicrobiales bacterium]|nr:DNA adenine methylase [Acidimicrobiales bacterium]